MIKSFLAVTLLAGGLAVPAFAAVDISASGDTTNVPFFELTQTVDLGASGANARLNVASLSADDLVVISVNGTRIVGAGIFGPGNGNVFFTAAGPSTPYAFAYNNGVVGATFAAPFTAGVNTITFTVNNNNAGINTGNNPLTGGPGNYDVSASITVPEPATWALMIGGFALTGFAMRRKVALAA